MGVADQMLLNQVTIFNQPSPYNSSIDYSSSNTKHTSQPTKPMYERTCKPSKYAYGWVDPRELYNG